MSYHCNENTILFRDEVCALPANKHWLGLDKTKSLHEERKHLQERKEYEAQQRAGTGVGLESLVGATLPRAPAAFSALHTLPSLPPALPARSGPPLPGKLLSLSFALSSIWPWSKQGLHSSIPAAAIPSFFECGNQVETSGNSQGGSFYSTHPSAPSVWADPHSNWTHAIRTNCKISDDGTVLSATSANVWANEW